MNADGYVPLSASLQRGRLWSLLRTDDNESVVAAANMLLDPELCRYRVREDDGVPVVDCEVRFRTIGWAVAATWGLDDFAGADLDSIVDVLVDGLEIPNDPASLL